MEAPMLSADGSTLLIVEDDPNLTELFRHTMEKGGFRVIAAASGPEALRLLDEAAGGVRLAVIDLTLPGMSGLDLTRELETVSPGLPIIIATGHAVEDIGTLPPNVVEAIQKPYRNKVLAERIREILDAQGG